MDNIRTPAWGSPSNIRSLCESDTVQFLLENQEVPGVLHASPPNFCFGVCPVARKDYVYRAASEVLSRFFCSASLRMLDFL